MSSKKTTTVTFRVDPEVKAALQQAAELERRSLANMIEVLILDYCGRNDITIPEQVGLPGGESKG